MSSTNENEINLKKELFRRNSIQVLNLFENKLAEQNEQKSPLQIPDNILSNHSNDDEIKKKEKDELLKQLERFDENVRHAIILRREKDPKSEFYRKLESLNERIGVYRDIFCSRQPSFMTFNNKYSKRKNLPKINKHQSKTDLSESPKKHPKVRKSQFDSIMQEIMINEENDLKANHNSHVRILLCIY